MRVFNLYFASFLILFPHNLNQSLFRQIVIWNVGQGQWITAIDENQCYHFDVGGEFFNPKKISNACSKKKNRIFFSHWDWDHIGLALKLKSSVKELCIAVLPNGPSLKYKVQFLEKIPNCTERFFKNVENLNFSFHSAKKDNDYSHVYIYEQKILIPGDSTSKMEKIWSTQIQNKKIPWLSVSHHGSKTSSSEVFLRNSGRFKMAFVSARYKKYRHPHFSIVKRFKNHHIPLIRTEDWGNIHLLLGIN